MRAVRPIAEQTILVTGSTDGLGKGVATELARAGATVLIHGRDDARGRRTVEEIRTLTGNQRLVWLRADFASLDEVRALAREVSRNTSRLDVLVNNAGRRARAASSCGSQSTIWRVTSSPASSFP